MADGGSAFDSGASGADVLDLVSEWLRKIVGVDGLDVITALKETKDAFRYFGAIG